MKTPKKKVHGNLTSGPVSVLLPVVIGDKVRPENN